MSTAYPFPRDLAEHVEAQMASGQYETPDDLLRDALDALSRQNADLAAIRRGFEDEVAGRVKSLAEVHQALRAKYGIPQRS